MGKPVPSSEPVVITPGQAAQTNLAAAGKKGVKTKISSVHQKGNVVMGTPKVAFVSAGQLTTIKNEKDKEGEENSAQQTESNGTASMATTSAPSSTVVQGKVTQISNTANKNNRPLYLPNEKDVAPVGAEYVDEIPNEFGKVVSYRCKLCDCPFNDQFAKEMHLKGRRHRLAYKQKVDPSLEVETKSNSFKNRKAMAKAATANQRYFQHPQPGYTHPHKLNRPVFRSRPLNSSSASEMDDRYVMDKHLAVYASEGELEAIQKLVLRVECALKMVSDQLLEKETEKERKKVESLENGIGQDGAEVAKTWTPTQQQIQQMRELRGVQRIGNLAKGLLICNDRKVEVAVMCLHKPTLALLESIADLLPDNLIEAESNTSFTSENSVNRAELTNFNVKVEKDCGGIFITTVAKIEKPHSDNQAINIDEKGMTPDYEYIGFHCRVFFTTQCIEETPEGNCFSL